MVVWFRFIGGMGLLVYVLICVRVLCGILGFVLLSIVVVIRFGVCDVRVRVISMFSEVLMNIVLLMCCVCSSVIMLLV